MLYDFSKKKAPAYPNLSADRAASLATRSSLPKPLGRAGAQQGPMPDGGTLAAHMAARGGQYDASGAVQQAYLPQQPQPTRASNALSPDYRAPSKSAASGLTVNWDSARTAMQTQARDRINREATGAQRAARINAAKRGLFQGGSPARAGIYQNMLADIDSQRFGATQNAFNDIDLSLTNAQRDFNLRVAGQEDSYNQFAQGAAIQLSRLPAWLRQDAAAADSAELRNRYTRDTYDTAVNSANAGLTEQHLRNQGLEHQNTQADLRNRAIEFEIDETVQMAPERREEARLRLDQLRTQIENARRAGDWALADELGGIAARVAKAGGWKWVGLGVGAAVGSIVPGAGTWAGAGVGANVGNWLDTTFG